MCRPHTGFVFVNIIWNVQCFPRASSLWHDFFSALEAGMLCTYLRLSERYCPLSSFLIATLFTCRQLLLWSPLCLFIFLCLCFFQLSLVFLLFLFFSVIFLKKLFHSFPHFPLFSLCLPLILSLPFSLCCSIQKALFSLKGVKAVILNCLPLMGIAYAFFGHQVDTCHCSSLSCSYYSSTKCWWDLPGETVPEILGSWTLKGFKG